ncbi:molecular chaperone GroEL [Fuscibacter oryzae]|uniref:60 kDa chaperonin n=1 Tax=Fuscibacter oryzae TaxID=2803939 RepID=A0A8J7MUB8_9RHOB|nr:molecular chaperone GroEL [Fuscibacter oryzae]MBL4929767.1 molecular chaperone GroEL [Fuscibacter oryzae]
MPNMLLHSAEARRALARGVARLAAAVEPTLGPKGLNAMIDRPVGTPLITRDGVSIATEIELSDRFENMGAQVVREVSMQTNEVAGDGTTTAIVLANAMIQQGVAQAERGARGVDLCRGIELAVGTVVAALRRQAVSVKDNPHLLTAVANIAATDPRLGAIVAEAHQRVGADGIISADFSVTVDTTLEVIEGMSFERGYLSHHMVTDQDEMEAVLDRPLILLTDQKILDPTALDSARKIADAEGRPLLIVAEEIAPEVIVTLLEAAPPGKYLIVHPPEYGHWRRAQMDDLAILTGGEVLARDLGKKVEAVTRDQLGAARQVRASASQTTVIKGEGDPAAITARRLQVQRQYDVAPPNIEQDKLRERLAKLSGGTAVIYAGGLTPVEQKRKIQLIEDSLHAIRAAVEEGVVPGGGSALAHVAPELDSLAASHSGDVAAGIDLVRSVLTRPLARIAINAGCDPNSVIAEVIRSGMGHGFDAANGTFRDMIAAGIVDPLRVTCAALGNAASVACLILTTETLIGHAEDYVDPTAGPALGGGSERLGRQ